MSDAYNDIQNKSDTILYKKKGRKYVPATDPWAYNGLSAGWWLVKVQEHGGVSMRSTIYPRRAEIVTAARDKADALTKIIREATEAKPNKTPISPEALEDWKAFIAKHGEEFNMLYYPSFHDTATKIINELMSDKAPQNESYF